MDKGGGRSGFEHGRGCSKLGSSGATLSNFARYQGEGFAAPVTGPDKKMSIVEASTRIEILRTSSGLEATSDWSHPPHPQEKVAWDQACCEAGSSRRAGHSVVVVVVVATWRGRSAVKTLKDGSEMAEGNPSHTAVAVDFDFRPPWANCCCCVYTIVMMERTRFEVEMADYVRTMLMG
jgi:hypothetical protein